MKAKLQFLSTIFNQQKRIHLKKQQSKCKLVDCWSSKNFQAIYDKFIATKQDKRDIATITIAVRKSPNQWRNFNEIEFNDLIHVNESVFSDIIYKRKIAL